jgi:hypothetical protein
MAIGGGGSNDWRRKTAFSAGKKNFSPRKTGGCIYYYSC